MAGLHLSAAIFVIYALVSLVWPLKIRLGLKLVLGAIVLFSGLKYIIYSHFGSVLIPELPVALIVTMEAAYSALMLMVLMAIIKDVVLLVRWIYRKLSGRRAGSRAPHRAAQLSSKSTARALAAPREANRAVGKSEFIFVNARKGAGRARIILHSLIAAIAIVTGVGGTLSQFAVPNVADHEVAIKNLPPELEGFTVVQLTDLHVGPILKRDFLQGVVDKTNELKPDLVVITGDLVDGSVSELKDEFLPLNDLKASYGVLAVTGNHEYYSGVTSWVDTWEAQGITFLTFLNNEHVRLLKVPLAIAGVPDPRGAAWSNRAAPDVEQAFKKVRPYPLTQVAYEHWSDRVAAVGAAAGSTAINVSSYVTDALSDISHDTEVVKLLLAHEPIVMAQNPEVDLVLTGHTHGGTMFFLKPFVGAYNLGYVSGMYQVNERTKIYVSNGTGIWSGFSCRVLVPAEITRFTLRAAK